MGDFADDALDRAIDEWLHPDEYDFDDPELDDYSHRRRSSSSVKCKFCGTRGYHWVNVSGHWRLVDGAGIAHTCNQYRRTNE